MDIIRNKYVAARRRRKLKRQQNGTDNATWGGVTCQEIRH